MSDKEKEKRKDAQDGPTIHRDKVYGFAMTSCKAFKWRAVICDEAVALRSPKSIAWRMVQALPKEALGGATATPAQNKITDWLGYTFACWLMSAIHDLYLWPAGKDAVDLTSKAFEPSHDANEPNLLTRQPFDENNDVRQL